VYRSARCWRVRFPPGYPPGLWFSGKPLVAIPELRLRLLLSWHTTFAETIRLTVKFIPYWQKSAIKRVSLVIVKNKFSRAGLTQHLHTSNRQQRADF
jgi:hypothetical protein